MKVVIVTNNYGDIVGCRHCGSLDTVGYKIHHPPFSGSINSFPMAWCKDHEEEVTNLHNKAEGHKDSILQAGSNS